MAKKTEIWVCRDGREIAIADMENDHLRNLYRYLLDRAPVYRKRLVAELDSNAASAYGYSGGDMAEMAAESYANDQMAKAAYVRHSATADEVLAACIPQWGNIKAAMRNRNLMPKVAPRGKDRRISSIVGAALQVPA